LWIKEWIANLRTQTQTKSQVNKEII